MDFLKYLSLLPGIKVRIKQPPKKPGSGDKKQLDAPEDLARRDDIIGVYVRAMAASESNGTADPESHVIDALRDAAAASPGLALAEMRTKDGLTLAHMAAWDGNAGVLAWLAAKDSDLLHAKDNENRTPLHYAVELNRCFEGKAKCTEFLLKHNANATARSASGATALHELMKGAEHFEHDQETADAQIECAGLLLRHKAEINAVDNQNATPLYEAVYRYAEYPVVAFLLSNGADHTIAASRSVDKPSGFAPEVKSGMNALELAKFLNMPYVGRFEYETKGGRKTNAAPIPFTAGGPAVKLPPATLKRDGGKDPLPAGAAEPVNNQPPSDGAIPIADFEARRRPGKVRSIAPNSDGVLPFTQRSQRNDDDLPPH